MLRLGTPAQSRQKKTQPPLLRHDFSGNIRIADRHASHRTSDGARTRSGLNMAGDSPGLGSHEFVIVAVDVRVQQPRWSKPSIKTVRARAAPSGTSSIRVRRMLEGTAC